MNKKFSLILLALAIALMMMTPGCISSTTPLGSLPGTSGSVITSLITPAFKIIIDIFSLDAFGISSGLSSPTRELVAVTRFLIWILIFAVFNYGAKAAFSGIGAAGGGRAAVSSQSLPAILSFTLATMTAIFMPAHFLVLIAEEYSSFVFWALALAPFALIIFIQRAIPRRSLRGNFQKFVYDYALGILFLLLATTMGGIYALYCKSVYKTCAFFFIPISFFKKGGGK